MQILVLHAHLKEILCVCVCACVGERERERERELGLCDYQKELDRY